MGSDNRLDDGEPEPGAITAALSGWIDAIETVEEFREVLGRYFRAGILDNDAGVACV